MSILFRRSGVIISPQLSRYLRLTAVVFVFTSSAALAQGEPFPVLAPEQQAAIEYYHSVLESLENFCFLGDDAETSLVTFTAFGRKINGLFTTEKLEPE